MERRKFVLKRLSLNLEHVENPFYYDNEDVIKKLIQDINNIVDSQIVQFSFKKYEPQGYTGIALIQDSSISVNTYPELNFISIDVSTCMEKCDTYKVLDYIKQNIKCRVFFNFTEYEINNPEKHKNKWYIWSKKKPW